MSGSKKELGARLRAARESAGLTQANLAETLGVPRSAVAEIEAGTRSVSALELVAMARACGRQPSELLQEAPLAADPVGRLLAAHPELEAVGAVAQGLRDRWFACGAIAVLEEQLELSPRMAAELEYRGPAPASRWNALQQGREVAGQERARLGLGTAPVQALAELLQAQGLRVDAVELPEGTQGAMLHEGGTRSRLGPLVLVNDRLPRAQRGLALAHAYAHVRLDRERGAVLCRGADREDLMEVRANAFAAHFLMPEAGVLEFLAASGKGDSGRQVQVVADAVCERPVDAVYVTKRSKVVQREIQPHDVVLLAHHAGVGYGVALAHLLNLQVLTHDRHAAMQLEEDRLQRLVRLLVGAEAQVDDEAGMLARRVVALALEAQRRECISRRKCLELARDAGVDADLVAAVQEDLGLGLQPVGP